MLTNAKNSAHTANAANRTKKKKKKIRKTRKSTKISHRNHAKNHCGRHSQQTGEINTARKPKQDNTRTVYIYIYIYKKKKKKKLPSKEESQTVKHKTILRKETKFVPKMFRKTKSSLCIKKELGYLDSNQERMNQNHLCCQLHHTPITRSIFYAYSSEKTSKRTPNRI